MKKARAVLCSAVIVLAASAVALFEIRSHAQNPTIEPQTSQRQDIRPGSPESQSAVDAMGNKRYLVGPGDVLDVRVFGQSDLNSTVEIDDEGNISSLPFIETPIPAMCRNEKEIQKQVAAAYGKYIKNPRVSVRIVERKSRPPATVFGAVRAPTRIEMKRRVRLHELLAAAGGITLNASGTIQIIHTERELCPQDVPVEIPAMTAATNTSTVEKASPAATTSDQPAMTPISNQTTSSAAVVTEEKPAQSPTTGAADAKTQDQDWQPIPLSDKEKSDIGQINIYQTGDVRNGLGKDDPYIRPGDIVIVTEGEPIYVNGYVNAPREIIMKDGMTLGRAIAMAGGIQKTAKGSAVRVYRMEKGRVGPKVLKVDYDAIKKGGPDFLLQGYDIIDVRPSSMVSPANLVELFKGMTRGSIGGMSTTLPYRVMY